MGNIHGNCINVDELDARRLDLLRQAAARLPDRQRRLVHAGGRRRPGPTAACTSSTGTTAITATRTPAATPPASTGSRAGSTASATRTRRRPPAFDLTAETDDQLIERLGSPNVYLPRHRPAAADGAAQPGRKAAKQPRTSWRLIIDAKASRKARHARPLGAGRRTARCEAELH